MRAGLAVLAVPVLGLAGCGPAALSTAAVAVPAPQVATRAPDPNEPRMVYVLLTDQGFRPTDIALALDRPVMLMVVDHGTRAHRLHATLPMASLQVFDPYVTTQQPVTAPANGFDVTVPAAHEIDVIFTPAQPGSYALAGDTTTGAVAVG